MSRIAETIEAFPSDEYPIVGGAKLRASFAGACARQVQFRTQGAEGAPVPASSRIAFKIGHAVGDLIAAALQYLEPGGTQEAPGILCVHDEFAHPWSVLEPCSAGTLIGCHADFATDRKVYEVKTMQTFAFNKGPNEHHILQAGICALALDVREIELVYIDKAKGEIATYPFGWEDFYAQALDEAIRLARVLRGDAPMIDPTHQHWRCRYCPFESICK
jgi:hypothetical protein